MTHIQTIRAWAAALGLITMTALALAGEGHEHGEAPSATAEHALARFEAASDQFELVGVLDGRKLTLYLDQSADNSPVKGASLQIEFAGQALPVKPLEEGMFEATLAFDPEAGEHTVSATVVAGQASDLLVGELHVHEAAHMDAAHGSEGGAWPMGHGPRWLLWALPALVVLAAGLFFILRQKRARVGGAA